VDEPERVTPAQMDRWCKDFDNWGICDTVCFFLFDRTPMPSTKSSSGQEQGRVRQARSVCAAGLCALHKKRHGRFEFSRVPFLPRRAAKRRTKFREKIRQLGLASHRETESRTACCFIEIGAAAWRFSAGCAAMVGKDALRDLTKPAVIRRLKS